MTDISQGPSGLELAASGRPSVEVEAPPARDFEEPNNSEKIEVDDGHHLLNIRPLPDSSKDSRFMCSTRSCGQRFRSKHCLQVHEYACHHKPPTLAKPTRIKEDGWKDLLEAKDFDSDDDAIGLPSNP